MAEVTSSIPPSEQATLTATTTTAAATTTTKAAVEPSRTNLPPSPDKYDNRLLWIKDRVKTGIVSAFNNNTATSTATAGDLFNECLERNNRQSLAELMDYLDGLTTQSSLLFYAVPRNAAKVRYPSVTPFSLTHMHTHTHTHTHAQMKHPMQSTTHRPTLKSAWLSTRCRIELRR